MSPVAQLPTDQAQRLYQKRYQRDDKDWDATCVRMASSVTLVEEHVEAYYDLFSRGAFLPNTPTIINAGRGGTMSACFTLVPDDSLDSIFDIANLAQRLLKDGGGVGYGLSRLRPAGSLINSTKGRARGPVAAMVVYQAVAEFVEQAGARDGAQMAILHCEHPDINAFIHLKDKDPQRWNTFNISVAATDKWMGRVVLDSGHGESLILQEIAKSAWSTGDPGLYFIDRAERDNPTPFREIGEYQPLRGSAVVAV